MPGDDAGLLVVPGGVPGELEDLRGEVLHHGGHVEGSTGAHALGVVTLPAQSEVSSQSDHNQTRHLPVEPVDPAHRELEAGPAGAGLALAEGLGLTTLATSGHS